MGKIRFFLVTCVLVLLFLPGGCIFKNKPPVWSAIPNATIDAGQTVTRDLSSYASDPDGDLLTFSVVSGPGLIAGAIYSYTAAAPLGLKTAVVKASDGRGGEAETSFTITVKSQPNVPSSPSPAHGAVDQNYPSLTLSWMGGDPDGDAVTYDIFFGTAASPPLVKSNHTTTSHTVSGLVQNTKYYWKIIAKDGTSQVIGPVWSFMTKPNPPPNTPSNPSPANAATNQNYPSVTLSWTGGDPEGETVVYDIYFGTAASPPLVKSNHTTTGYTVGSLVSYTRYYWKIVAKDGTSTSTSPVWSFMTKPVTLINETFETRPLGVPNLPWGTYNYGGTSKGLITNFGNPGKALTFEDPTTAGYAQIYKTSGWSSFKSCALQFDFRVSAGGAFGVRIYSNAGNFEPYIFIGPGAGGWGLYAVNGNWNFKKLTSISSNTWYRVVVNFSYSTSVYNVYLNGAFVGSQSRRGTAANSLYGIQLLVFDDYTCGYVDIDNVMLVVYDSGYTVSSIDPPDVEWLDSSDCSSGFGD
jgi:hypothetical protein